MIVARTTLSRDGHTILNHSPRTDLIYSSIFFINKPVLIRLLFAYTHRTNARFLGFLYGRGRRNRTLIRGFGDRYSTVELCPCFMPDVPHMRYIVCATIPHKHRKSSGKYYKILLRPLQVKKHTKTTYCQHNGKNCVKISRERRFYRFFHLQGAHFFVYNQIS